MTKPFKIRFIKILLFMLFLPFVLSAAAPERVSLAQAVDIHGSPHSSHEEMVFIDGGVFMMGAPDGGPEERPVHEVHVSAFYLGAYEVTQARYRSLMGANPSYFRGDDLPVEQAKWEDALRFCNELSLREGLKPVYALTEMSVVADWSADGYRLPTEAEWEYASRGGLSGMEKPTEYSGSDSPDTVAWYQGNSRLATHTVGLKNPNALGLYDMSGNVWEWCWDWYGPYETGIQKDPQGSPSGTYRVVRGGSWYGNAFCLRSACRNGYGLPGYVGDYGGGGGFRVARSAGRSE